MKRRTVRAEERKLRKAARRQEKEPESSLAVEIYDIVNWMLPRIVGVPRKGTTTVPQIFMMAQIIATYYNRKELPYIGLVYDCGNLVLYEVDKKQKISYKFIVDRNGLAAPPDTIKFSGMVNMRNPELTYLDNLMNLVYRS